MVEGPRQGWTGHNSNNATLVAGAFPISHTKCKKGPFVGILEPFEFFCKVALGLMGSSPNDLVFFVVFLVAYHHWRKDSHT
jgi:hypothetical protein